VAEAVSNQPPVMIPELMLFQSLLDFSNFTLGPALGQPGDLRRTVLAIQ